MFGQYTKILKQRGGIMGKEIKYRAWDLDHKEMQYSEDHFYHLGEFFNWYFDRSEKKILMQSTTLKNKNGIEIYEGDIINWGGYKNCLVKYHEIGYTFGGICFHYVNAIEDLKFEDIEVIGNRWENPELLEES